MAVLQPSTRPGVRCIRPPDWARAAAWATAFAVVIAVPTRLLPNGWFRRMTPTRPQDYVFLVVASALAGLVMSLRRRAGGAHARAAAGGGFGTFLAVGCPVCNKVVVALIGVSGATSIFAPIQPAIGIVSIGLLAWALGQTLHAPDACAVPVRDGDVR